eukprot:341805-Chlamydomonas_euryale.AAC.1
MARVDGDGVAFASGYQCIHGSTQPSPLLPTPLPFFPLLSPVPTPLPAPHRPTLPLLWSRCSQEEAKLLDEFEVPEGASKFDVGPDDIARVMSQRDLEVEPVADVQTPRHLLPPEEVGGAWRGAE